MEQKQEIDLRRDKKPSLREEIVRQVSEMITNGRLIPGDRLLSERQLAEILGVSRTAIRESLAKLASMGIIEVKPGEGAYVKQFSLAALVEPLATALLGEREAVEQLLEVRSILESKAVLLASKRANSQDIARLKWHALRVIEDINGGSEASETDTEFHLTLAVATHNKLLVNIMSMLSGLMRETYNPARKKILSGPNAKLYGEHHLRICEAIAARRGKEAEQLMLEHLELARREALEC
jgi:GntR family transcriptional repressor for pyruvate dehydrogenase complex